MNSARPPFAVTVLRWCLGLVVLLQSALFVFSPFSIPSFEKTGFPHWFRPALGGTELVAAILFLIPLSHRWGGYLLIAIFLLATLAPSSTTAHRVS